VITGAQFCEHRLGFRWISRHDRNFRAFGEKSLRNCATDPG
jgi:hypothetical protein